MNLRLSKINKAIAVIDLPTHIGPDMIEPFEQLTDELGEDDEAKVVVLRGGPQTFNAGASRAALLDGQQEIQHYVASLPRALLKIPVPTIAAMAGHAVGGGMILGLWCDHVLLSQESLYGANFMALGFTPGMGSTFIVTDTFGPSLGRELLYTGRMMTGEELRQRGAAMPIMPKATVEDAAMELADEISQIPVRALRLLRQTLTRKRCAELEEAVGQEFVMHQAVFADDATRARIASVY